MVAKTFISIYKVKIANCLARVQHYLHLFSYQHSIALKRNENLSIIMLLLKFAPGN